MASFNPASGVWPEDYDEVGNVVRRNQDARQVHPMNNMPGRLPPPPPALSPRGTFVPETHCYPHFPGQLPPPPPASSPRITFVPEARYPYFPGQVSPPPPASSPRGSIVPGAHSPHFPPGPDFTSSARPPAGFRPLANWPSEKRSHRDFPLNYSSDPPAVFSRSRPPTLPEEGHVVGAPPARDEVAPFHDSPSDLWTPGYDQFGNSCWQNKLTLELHYDTPPRQPPAHPLQFFAGHPRYPHLPIDHPFEHDPRPPPERFPPRRELGKDVRSPPPSWPRAPASPNKSKNEADQWFLQRNGINKEYYLNTSTGEWKYETPDCLKK